MESFQHLLHVSFVEFLDLLSEYEAIDLKTDEMDVVPSPILDPFVIMMDALFSADQSIVC